MKLSLTQENLAKALATVGRVVSARSSLPVLSNVLLATDANRLKLSATNLEIGINYRVGCKVESEGSVTVPARLLGELITSLPGGNLEFSTNNLSLQIKSPHFESTINGISADEFPAIPELKNEPALVLEASDLREALEQVVVAASLDEARPVLAGVYLYTEDGHLMVVATDSYRLAEKKLKLKSGQANSKLSVIIPARTMQELARILSDSQGEVSLHLGENQAMFVVEDVELTTRLIEGQFPNYRQIIPAQVATTVELETAELSRITKVASLFARENAGGVKIEVRDGKISVISTASQLGENTSTADCATTGEDNDITLNARYLSDALTAVKADRVSFSISGKLNPCIVKPVVGKNADKTKESYLHIIMPLRT